MRARQLLQALRAALHAFDSPLVVLSRQSGDVRQLQAAHYGCSAWGCPQRHLGSPQAMPIPAATRAFTQLASSQQLHPAHLAQHQTAAAASVGRVAVARSVITSVVQQAPWHAGLHTTPIDLSASGGSSTDPAQGRQSAPGINPLQMSPGTMATGSPAASVPQPAASAAAAAEPRRARAIARNLKISPQKLNDFAAVVRRMHVQDAVLQCRYSVKKAAKIVEKARTVSPRTLRPQVGHANARFELEIIVGVDAKFAGAPLLSHRSSAFLTAVRLQITLSE